MAPSAPLTVTALSWPPLAVQPGHLPELETACRRCRRAPHLLHAVRARRGNRARRWSKRERFATGCRFERPVERRIAAADDEDVAAAQILHLPHRIEDRLAFVGLDARERRRFGVNEPPPAAITTTLASITVPASVVSAEAAVVSRSSVSTRWLKWNSAPNGLICSMQLVGQLLAGDDRQAGNVVDRLLGVELGALAAGSVENVDDVRFDIEKAELEHGKQADGPGANDDGIGLDDQLARSSGYHSALKTASRGCARRGRQARR